MNQTARAFLRSSSCRFACDSSQPLVEFPAQVDERASWKLFEKLKLRRSRLQGRLESECP